MLNEAKKRVKSSSRYPRFFVKYRYPRSMPVVLITNFVFLWYLSHNKTKLVIGSQVNLNYILYIIYMGVFLFRYTTVIIYVNMMLFDISQIGYYGLKLWQYLP